MKILSIILAAAFVSSSCLQAVAGNTNDLASMSVPALPAASTSILRLLGALALVFGLFFGGVWLFKNWQRLAVQRGQRPQLNIHESRSLGARQSVMVVGYDRQRFLVAASPAGITFLTHLPDADNSSSEPAEKMEGPMPFAQALAKVLKKTR